VCDKHPHRPDQPDESVTYPLVDDRRTITSGRYDGQHEIFKNAPVGCGMCISDSFGARVACNGDIVYIIGD